MAAMVGGRGAWIVALALAAPLAGRSEPPQSESLPTEAAQTEPPRFELPAGLDEAVARLVTAAADAVREAPADIEAWTRLCMACEANLLWPEAARCYGRLAALDARPALWELHGAIAALELGDTGVARDLLASALERQPDLQPARHRLADLLLEAGDLEGAARLFDELITALPASAAGYLGAGEVDLLADRVDRATERLERAVALDPSSAPAHYQLGLAYRAAGRLAEAERELALGAGGARDYLPSPLAERIAPLAVHVTAQVDRAAALLAAGRNDEASALLESLVLRSPDDPTLLNDLAVAYLRQGRLDAARTLLDRAVAIEERDFRTRLNLSSWALRAGRPEEAVEQARLAVDLAPGVAATHLALARALAEPHRVAGEVDPAATRRDRLAALERAVELGVDTPDAYLELGRERWRDGGERQALETLDAALRRWPDFWPGYLMQAWILVRDGRFDEGEERLERVRELAPGHADIDALERLIEEGRGRSGA
jgi:tetratricopeptide (TPR) repeat protein